MNRVVLKTLVAMALGAASIGCGEGVACTGGATVQNDVCMCPEPLVRVDGECTERETSSLDSSITNPEAGAPPSFDAGDGGADASAKPDAHADAGVDAAPPTGMPTCRVSVEETCDERDNDCDGAIDEGVKNACGGCGPIKSAPQATTKPGDGCPFYWTDDNAGDCATIGTVLCDGPNATRCEAPRPACAGPR